MELKVRGHTIEFYDSPENLSIKRYQLFNKHLMLDCEVGSTLADHDRRMQRAIRFVQSDMKVEALRELENDRQTVLNCLSGYSPKGRALAVLVKRIDRTAYTATDSRTLEAITQRLDLIGLTKEMMDRVVDEVKKK